MGLHSSKDTQVCRLTLIHLPLEPPGPPCSTRPTRWIPERRCCSISTTPQWLFIICLPIPPPLPSCPLQHSTDALDPDKTVLQFFKDTYPNDPNVGWSRTEEEWRGFIGRYGISGKLQTTRIKDMSDGQVRSGIGLYMDWVGSVPVGR